MVENSATDVAGEREPVEILAAEFVERQRNGENPSVESYAQMYPDLADEIRDLFPTIIRLEGLKVAKERSSDGRATAGLPRSMTLNGFRILRELGRGGMGVVYEAEDQSLKRRVALKVLGANIADSALQLQRFRHEAEAAARLHHPHIVPVFGTGDEHGVRFYVMQYIDGLPLSDVIARLQPASGTPAVTAESSGQNAPETLPSGATHAWRNWRTIAEIAVDLADALAYAHGQGVLHRDIKPGNVLVDQAGCVWLGDFGLAKHEGHAGVTKTGDLVGTLRYMAPEQFQEQSDARCDIYSLGLTVYELLTLQPAFPGSQHGPLIQQKTATGVASPRLINPDIPRDLETITLKACALEPAHRYQTARELVEDLRRFLVDRPILARRVSPVERLWRWSRRNPLVAGLSGVAVVLLAAVAVVFAVGSRRTNDALSSAVQAARVADAERGRAEDNLQRALRALDEIMKNVSERGIPQTLHVGLNGEESSLQNVMVTEADAALLQSLLHFFDEFASENRANLNAQTATALQRIGTIQQRLGKLSEAEKAFLQSVEIYQRLVATSPQDRQLALDLATTWNNIGTVRSQGGDVPDAVEAHVTALEVIESSATANASDAGQFLLAETFTLIGSVGSRTGGGEVPAGLFAPPELAAGHHEPGRSGSRGSPPRFDDGFPPSAPPKRAGPRPDFSERQGSRRQGPERARRRPDPAPWDDETFSPPPRFDRDQALRRAVAILKELLERDPENATYQFTLAKCYRSQIHLGPRGGRRGSASDVRQAADEAIRILRKLVGTFPNAPVYTYELSGTLCRAAQRIPDADRVDRAGWLQEALQFAAQLVLVHPQIPEYQALLASVERRLGEFAHVRGDSAEAERRYQHALELHSRLSTRFSSVSLYQIAYAQTLAEWAEVQRATGQIEAARETLGLAVGVAERSTPMWGNDPMFRDFLAQLHRQQRELAESRAGN